MVRALTTLCAHRSHSIDAINGCASRTGGYASRSHLTAPPRSPSPHRIGQDARVVSSRHQSCKRAAPRSLVHRPRRRRFRHRWTWRHPSNPSCPERNRAALPGVGVPTSKLVNSLDPPRPTPQGNRRRLRQSRTSGVAKSVAMRCSRAGWRTVRRKPRGGRGTPIRTKGPLLLSP